MPTNTEYTITDAAKRAAREERRLKYFLKLSGEIYRQEQNIERTNKYIEKKQKTQAVYNFEFNLFTPKDHPDYENLKKNLDETAQNTETAIKNLERERAGYETEIAKIKEEQAKVTSGETKMNYDAILERAHELITIAVEKDFLNGGYTKETK